MSPKDTTALATSATGGSFPDLLAFNDMTLPEAAVAYAEMSWRVIPLEPEGKRPHPEFRKGWTTNASNDPDTVRSWWTKCPDANIGICPEDSGIICLDLDNKPGKANGVETFERMLEGVGGPEAQTPNRGIHRLFLADPKARNRSPRDAGFDLLVSAKQFVAAPSVVPNERDGKLTKYMWTATNAPQPMPEVVREKIEEVSRKSHIDGQREPGDAGDCPGLGEPLPIPHGFEFDRDDRSRGMFFLSLQMWRYRGDVNPADILATIWQVPEFRAAAMERRGNEDRALDWIWKYSVFSASSNKVVIPFPTSPDFDPTDLPPLTAWEQSESYASSESARSVAERLLSSVSPLSNLMRVTPKPRFVVDGWFPRGLLTTLFGEDGCGKTTLMTSVATCLSVGRSVLGEPVEQPGNVWLLCAEDTWETLMDRQERVAESLGLTSAELALMDRNLTITNLMMEDVTMIRPDGSKGPFRDVLAEMIDIAGAPDMIVLDPISDLYASNENDRGKVAAFLRDLNMLAARADASVVLLGHPPKADGVKFSGSTAWSSKSRSRLWLKQDGTVVRLSQEKATIKERKAARTLVRLPPHGVLVDLDPAHVEVRERQQREATKREIVLALTVLAKRDITMSSNKRSDDHPSKLLRKEQIVDENVPESVIERAFRELLDADVLSASVPFDGKEERPKLVNSSRHHRRGVWFGAAYREEDFATGGDAGDDTAPTVDDTTGPFGW